MRVPGANKAFLNTNNQAYAILLETTTFLPASSFKFQTKERLPAGNLDLFRRPPSIGLREMLNKFSDVI